MEKFRWVSLPAVIFLLASCQSAQKKSTVHPDPKAQVPRPSSPTPTSTTARVSIPETSPPRPAPAREAERLYQQGLDLYRRGDFAAARRNFDQALMQLLESPLAIRSDPNMATTFRRLVEDIHALEVTSLENDAGVAKEKYEASPIEEFADRTFFLDPTLQDRIGRQVNTVRSDLPVVSNEIVERLIVHFQGDGRPFIEKVIRRLGRYRPLLTRTLRQEGVPEDLIYLAAAESGFNPFALSSASAKGMWQFMRWEGRKYGLRIDSWVDEREVPEKATVAAAGYLRNLYREFGDWLLAMAAYNGGPGRMRRAVQRTGYADFWELYKRRVLPRETRNYVPIIMATMIIMKEPWAYGFHVVPEDPLIVDQVTLTAPIDLRLAAQAIDIPVKEMIDLNPGLLRWSTPLNDPKYVLNLPPGSREKFLQSIGTIPEKQRLWWRFHTVKAGENPAGVAKKYKLTAQSLAKANGITLNAPWESGEKIILPLAPGQQVDHRYGRTRMVRYRIHRGDTLGGIARRFRVRTSQIRRWNGMRGSRIIAGRTLRLYVPYRGGPETRSSRARTRSRRPVAGQGRLVRYRIRGGDNLTLISQRFGVSLSQIRRWNGMRGSRILAGQTLRIYVQSSGGSSDGRTLASNGSAPSGYYRIRRGDTLTSIAQQSHVSIAQIRRWNRLRGSRIVAGQSLRVAPPSSVSSSTQSENSSQSSEGRLIHYQIQKGDTLWSISQRFEVSESQIRKWNNLRGLRISAGQTLRIYVRSR